MTDVNKIRHVQVDGFKYEIINPEDIPKDQMPPKDTLLTEIDHVDMDSMTCYLKYIGKVRNDG